MAQARDPLPHLGSRPVLEQPLGQRIIRTADRERLVLIGAAVGEQLQRMGQLVIDLERVAVGIGEVKAALIDVIGGPEDLYAVLPK